MLVVSLTASTLFNSFAVAGVCTSLIPYQGTQNDASGILLACIDATPDGGTLELPPGKYYVGQQIAIRKSLTLKTQGRSFTDVKCNYIDDSSCAELIGRPELRGLYGLLFVDAANTRLDHLVINGNRSARTSAIGGNECKAGNNQYGVNISINGPNNVVTNIVSKETMCGSGLQTMTTPHLLIKNNSIVSNGQHTGSLWSDGITVLNGENVTVEDNEIRDNSDVDLILFSCKNCSVRNNSITHSSSFLLSSFAGIMLGGGVPNHNGDFTGTNVHNNTVDCGTSRRCGFGIYIGNDAWLSPGTGLPVLGGNVYDNAVRYAQQGFSIDHTANLRLANNSVTNSGGSFAASCGTKSMSSYSVAPGSNVDFSGDSIPRTNYVSATWDGCIPNWWVSDSVPPQPPSSCDERTQPPPTWGTKNGQCLRSCGALGGTQATNTPCSNHGLSDAGPAYDVQYCCKPSGTPAPTPAPTPTPSPTPQPTCNPSTQPSPHWGIKNGQCLRSCGAVGGTHAMTTPCSNHGLVDAGQAYDIAYCCKASGSPAPSPTQPACNPNTQPSPHWGTKNGQCLKSCGALGGTRASAESCSRHGMTDAGTAYDVQYCCK